MGLMSSLLLHQASSWPLRAADRLEVSIEGVVLPVEVDDLEEINYSYTIFYAKTKVIQKIKGLL